MSECVSDAYTVARKHGFTDSLELITDNGGSLKNLYGNHWNGELSIAISCSREDGTASYAVTGYDNDETWKMTDEIGDTYRKL